MIKTLLLEMQIVKTYHIYLKDEVLFKDLNEEEFDVIWGRLFHSYYKDDLTFAEITELESEKYIEASY